MTRVDHILLALLLAALALGAAAAVLPVRAQTPPVNVEATPIALDDFLVGFERSCGQGQDYRRFVQSVMRPEGMGFALTGEMTLPERLRPAFGQAELRQIDAVASVTIPVRGTYRGLAVTSLQLLRGPYDSTVGNSIFFNAPIAEVHRVLDPMIEESRRGLGGMEELGIEEGDGMIMLACFSTT